MVRFTVEIIVDETDAPATQRAIEAIGSKFAAVDIDENNGVAFDFSVDHNVESLKLKAAL